MCLRYRLDTLTKGFTDVHCFRCMIWVSLCNRKITFCSSYIFNGPAFTRAMSFVKHRHQIETEPKRISESCSSSYIHPIIASTYNQCTASNVNTTIHQCILSCIIAMYNNLNSDALFLLLSFY